MKIAMLGSRGIGHVAGGVETYVRGLAIGLAFLGHDVTVSCARTGIDGAVGPWAERTSGHIRIVNDGVVQAGLLEMPTRVLIGTLRAALDKHDVVHIHGADPALLALPILKLIRSRVVVTIHSRNYLSKERFGPLRRLLSKAAERAVYLSHHRVVTVSPHLIPENIPVERVDFIEPGCVFADYPVRRGIGRGIVVVTRIVPGKGLEMVADAARNYEFNDAFTIVGDGQAAYIKYLRARSEDGLHFVGPAFAEQLYERLASARALLMPSAVEGAPQVLLEALCVGTPVIAHPKYLLPFGDSPMLIPCSPLDPSGIASAVRVAATVTQDRHLVDKVRAHASWVRVAQNMANIYGSIVRA